MAKKKKRTPRRYFVKKQCQLCKKNIVTIDYKDVNSLKKFITRKIKILPRRMSGNCVKHQKRIAKSIKRARHMALLPYVRN